MTKPLADILRELESERQTWWTSDGAKVIDTPNLLPALKLAVEALDNISDGISPLGGITSPDGHRRRMAHEALAQITQLLQDGEK